MPALSAALSLPYMQQGSTLIPPMRSEPSYAPRGGLPKPCVRTRVAAGGRDAVDAVLLGVFDDGGGAHALGRVHDDARLANGHVVGRQREGEVARGRVLRATQLPNFDPSVALPQGFPPALHTHTGTTAMHPTVKVREHASQVCLQAASLWSGRQVTLVLVETSTGAGGRP